MQYLPHPGGGGGNDIASDEDIKRKHMPKKGVKRKWKANGEVVL